MMLLEWKLLQKWVTWDSNMKYINYYEAFSKRKVRSEREEFKKFKEKLKSLFEIIGFQVTSKHIYPNDMSCKHKIYTEVGLVSGNIEFDKLQIHTILTGIDKDNNTTDGSISRSLLLEYLYRNYEGKKSSLNNKEILEMYINKESLIMPVAPPNKRISTLLFNIINDKYEKEYTKIIKEVVQKLSEATSVYIQTSSQGEIKEVKYIFDMMIDVLKANTDYNKDIIIPDNVTKKLIEYINNYKYSYNLINEIYKNQPILSIEIKKHMGESADSASKMGEMGF